MAPHPEMCGNVADAAVLGVDAAVLVVAVSAGDVSVAYRILGLCECRGALHSPLL
jgi:hypothetical protein